MIDKMYALADYYLLNTTTEHSRHIYDIYKLSEIVTVDDTLKELALSVAEERRPHKMCLSVQNGIRKSKRSAEINMQRLL